MSSLDPHLHVGSLHAITPRRVVHVSPRARPAWLLYDALASAGHEVAVWASVADPVLREAAHVSVVDALRDDDVVVIDERGHLEGGAKAEAPALPELPVDVRVVQLRGVREPSLDRSGVVLRIGEVWSDGDAPWLERVVREWSKPARSGRRAAEPLWVVHEIDAVRAVVLAVDRGDGEVYVAKAPLPTARDLAAELGDVVVELDLPAPGPFPPESLSETLELGGVFAGRRSAGEVLGWAPVASLSESLRPALERLARRRLDGEARRGAARSFRLQGAWWRLAPEAAVAARDLETGEVTVRPAGEQAVLRISPEQLGVAAATGGRRSWSLRELTEAALEADFDDAWLHELVNFAVRHGLLQPSSGESPS